MRPGRPASRWELERRELGHTWRRRKAVPGVARPPQTLSLSFVLGDPTLLPPLSDGAFVLGSCSNEGHLPPPLSKSHSPWALGLHASFSGSSSLSLLSSPSVLCLTSTLPFPEGAYNSGWSLVKDCGATTQIYAGSLHLPLTSPFTPPGFSSWPTGLRMVPASSRGSCAGTNEGV